MSSRDLHNNIDVKRGISPAAATADNTPWVSQIVDTKGYESVEFLMQIGALADADATFTVLFEDGDAANLSDNAAVADAQLLGTEALAGFQFDDDNECRKIGYIGSKRYCRVTVTPAANTGTAFLAGLWLLGNARSKPSVNPPA
jgi:hypothetical protein